MKQWTLVVMVAVLLAGIWAAWTAAVGGGEAGDRAVPAPGSASGAGNAHPPVPGVLLPDPSVSEEPGLTYSPRSEAPDPGLAVMHAQMGDIADAYRESIRFPTYSRPLTEHDWQLLNPRAFVASEIPIEGVPDLRVSVELVQAISDMRTPLPVTVTAVSPTASVASVAVTLHRAGQSTAAMQLQASPANAGVQVFQGVLPPDLLAAAGAGEVILRAELQLASGESVAATAMLELYASAADLAYLGDAYVEGAHLVIPAYFEVFSRGHFRVQANLMDAATGAPVSHVNATFVLSEDAPVGLLKVHAATLRAMAAPGPYLLTDFNIRRSPSWPGDTSGYGSAAQPSYPVAGFALEGYSDEPYVDEQAQQRLQFLEQMSGQGASH